MSEKNWVIIEQLGISKTHPTKKTKVFEVRNKDDVFFGTIEWKNTWRQYVFTPPAYSTFWARSCLKQLFDFMEKLMQERKKTKKR